MVDQPETPKILDELSKGNLARNAGRTDRKKRTALKRIAVILVFISPLLLGIVFLGFQQWGLQNNLSELAQENSELNSIISSDNTRIQELEALLRSQSELPAANEIQIVELESTFNAELERLNVTISDLREQLDRAQQTANNRQEINEVEYLLRTASNRLQIEKDVPTAIMLLESADRLLDELADTVDFALREAVKSDLASLRSVEVTDIQALYLRMVGVITRIDLLPQEITGLPAYQGRLASPVESDNTPIVNRGFLDATLEFLGTVFVWRKWDQPPDRTMLPEQQFFMQQNLRLLMEQAQLALLSRQDAVYQDSLQRGIVLLRQVAPSEDERIEALITELQELAKARLAPPIPDLSDTLELLRQTSLAPAL